jgi:hypothetical protein
MICPVPCLVLNISLLTDRLESLFLELPYDNRTFAGCGRLCARAVAQLRGTTPCVAAFWGEAGRHIFKTVLLQLENADYKHPPVIMVIIQNNSTYL